MWHSWSNRATTMPADRTPRTVLTDEAHLHRRQTRKTARGDAAAPTDVRTGDSHYIRFTNQP